MAITISTTTGPFVGYTLAQMRALILRMLRVSDTTRFSPTNGSADYDWIDDALNRGRMISFGRRSACVHTQSLRDPEANQRAYRLPDDFLDLMAAYYYDDSLSDGYKELTVTTPEELTSRCQIGVHRRERLPASTLTVRMVPVRRLAFTRYPTLRVIPRRSMSSMGCVAVEWALPHLHIQPGIRRGYPVKRYGRIHPSDGSAARRLTSRRLTTTSCLNTTTFRWCGRNRTATQRRSPKSPASTRRGLPPMLPLTS